jgi:hypothetical protein
MIRRIEIRLTLPSLSFRRKPESVAAVDSSSCQDGLHCFEAHNIFAISTSTSPARLGWGRVPIWANPHRR